MNKILLFVFVVLSIILGCKPLQQTQKTASQDGSYTEDLSAVRPSVEDEVQSDTTIPDKIKRDPKTNVEAHFTVNKQLDAVLDSIDQLNLNRKYVEGYSIQIYSGPNREDALNAKKQFTLSAPELSSEVQYEQPNFKVKSGRYFTRLEAQKDFNQIKKLFPAAIVVPGQISIN